jgi:nucleoside triphosphate pyrophosphatase
LIRCARLSLGSDQKLTAQVRLVLASASEARLRTLRSAGLNPEVIVSGVAEDGEAVLGVAELTAQLARLKAEAVAARIDHEDQVDGELSPTVVIGCDSLLELDGVGYGKPGTKADAVRRWLEIRGRVGTLHTGHHVIVHRGIDIATGAAVASTLVHFADIRDEEIEAYVASNEPLLVAGGFTIDGLGGPFITKIEGDHHNVVGISLPLLRTMLNELGISWPSLWSRERR